MPHTFSRQDLYDLVWSEPMRDLAKRYNISDRGLAKACMAANIPVPERGYWNKVQAGKKVIKRRFPPRGLGQSDSVTIGGNAWEHYRESDEEILNRPIPPIPTFEADIESVQLQVEAMVKKVQLPKDLSKPHRLIIRLLDQDEARLKKKQADPFPSPWDGPIFRTAFEERRLNILNALFTCFESCGIKPHVSGREARDLSVAVGAQHISFTLDSADANQQLERERSGYIFKARGEKDRMRLVLVSRYRSHKGAHSWEDKDKDRLEKHLQEIVVKIIVQGEEYHRGNCSYQRDWLIGKKEEILEERRKQKIEAARKQQADLAKLEKQRVDHLLGQALGLHQANQIRAYVAAVQEANGNAHNPMPSTELAEWKNWALTQADRIDPIISESYKTHPKEDGA